MLGTALAGLAGAGLSLGQSWMTSAGPIAKLANKTAKKSYTQQKEKDLYYQKKYDEWKTALDYKQAREYAQNSAAWNVEGLKRANLNPILAATDGNFRGTFGQPSSGSPTSSGSMRGEARSFDAAMSAAQLASTARQNRLLGEQIKQVRAQTANIMQDTLNKRNTNGLTGTAATASVIYNKLKDAASRNNFGDKLVEVVGLRDRDGKYHDLKRASGFVGTPDGMANLAGISQYIQHTARDTRDRIRRFFGNLPVRPFFAAH